MPLCRDFGPNDWTLMTLAFELHLLGHSFKKDVKEEDRSDIHINHLDFYYQKYFAKQLTPKLYGVDTVQAIVELVKDAAYVDGKGKLVNCLAEEMERYQVFVKIAEEARRYRSLCVDAGDESAVLRIAVQHGSQQHQGGQKRTHHDWTPPAAGPPGGWTHPVAGPAGGWTAPVAGPPGMAAPGMAAPGMAAPGMVGPAGGWTAPVAVKGPVGGK